MYLGIGLVRRRGETLRAGLRSSRFSCSFSRSLCKYQHILFKMNRKFFQILKKIAHLSRSLRLFRSSSSRRLLRSGDERRAGGD